MNSKGRSTPGSNLPIVFTSFIGRQREIADISNLLASNHLISLVGAGGCGKTRLALRVATELSDQFTHSVRWVELARLTDPTLVLQTVAKTLSVIEQPGTRLIDTLVDSLCGRQTLLVLDNCEHLLAACAQLVEDLASCPDLIILTTSREPLGVTGETLYPVSPFVPPAAHLPINEVSQIDSVRLFVERAQSIVPNFTLTPDNAESIATICRDLDGIPLAIELASARVNVLGVKQIQERLDRRFDLLVSTARADERHRTLRTAIDWSYELLSSSERCLLQRLTLYTAGFTLNTAESACAWGEIQREDMLDLLTSLVKKSLVVAETLQGNEARYRLLETIRQYAQEKLKASEDWGSAHDHYLMCFLQLTEEIAPKLHEQYQQLWFNWLETENDNIRVALAWALAGQRIEAGLRIGTALFAFWQMRAYAREGYTWFKRLLNHADDRIPLTVRVNALTWSCVLAEYAGDASTAAALGQEAMALCESAGAEGKQLLTIALIGVATAAQALGDYETTYTVGMRVNDLFRELGDLYSLGTGIMVTGQIAIALGKYEAAQALLTEGLTMARAANDPFRIALTLNSLGDLARCEGRSVQARTPYEESLSLLRELGAAREVAATQHNLAYVFLHGGEVERAHALFRESLEAQRDQENRDGILEGLLGFAALASATGLAAESARLAAAAFAHVQGDSSIRWPPETIEYEHYSGLARTRLGDSGFETEQAIGRTLSIERAIVYALNLPMPHSMPSPDQPPATQVLTEREREVAVLIARGLSNGEIADKLVLSKRTVEKHIANILTELELTNRAQIVRWAVEQNLLKNSPSQ